MGEYKIKTFQNKDNMVDFLNKEEKAPSSVGRNAYVTKVPISFTRDKDIYTLLYREEYTGMVYL